jgi:hypothetical protein
MRIEKINAESIKDIESAKVVIKQLIDCIFVMQKDINRQLNHLTSQNVKSLDFNITAVKNIEKVLPKEVRNENN